MPGVAANEINGMKTHDTKIIFKDKIQDIKFDTTLSFLIYDRDLLKYSFAFKSWQKQFSHQYAVKSGEGLKDLKHFDFHIKNILKKSSAMNSRQMKFIVVGGGSLGDFGGFVASVFKRGVGLIHIPSTWLSAIDSSHGGKTALNVSGFKNQIGSFYPAEKVLIVKQLLEAQPAKRALEASGELVKIALIDGGSWTKRLTNTYETETHFYRHLKPAIAAKYKIIKQDPFERSGIRQILNLGHTWGHVLEAAFKIPHGVAVSLGLQFSINWSIQKKLLNSKEYLSAQMLLEILELPSTPKVSRSLALQLLKQDKKTKKNGHLNFIFLARLGRPKRLKVSIDSILQEAQRQGWIY